MARSRSLAGLILISRMFMLLLICLDKRNTAMLLYLLLAGVFYFNIYYQFINFFDKYILKAI
jgi:hypothetical protein